MILKERSMRLKLIQMVVEKVQKKTKKLHLRPKIKRKIQIFLKKEFLVVLISLTKKKVKKIKLWKNLKTKKKLWI